MKTNSTLTLNVKRIRSTVRTNVSTGKASCAYYGPSAGMSSADPATSSANPATSSADPATSSANPATSSVRPSAGSYSSPSVFSK